jgi:hypothetical protein
MSDISVISNQYEKLVSTSDKINNSVIAFKKKSLLDDSIIRNKYPKLSVSKEEIVAAKGILTSFLNNILNILEEGSQESEFIPSIILEDYKTRLLTNAYLKEDLKTLVDLLNKDLSIEEENIKVLDGILSILDNERSTLFRKLRTARG